MKTGFNLLLVYPSRAVLAERIINDAPGAVRDGHTDAAPVGREGGARSRPPSGFKSTASCRKH
jgi:hypothetical protein